MTYNEFYNKVTERAGKCPREWRYGQSVFNVVDEDYGVAREVQYADGVDCFYDDGEVDAFISAAYARLTMPVERYVSLETALLLKKRGFDGNACRAGYDGNGCLYAYPLDGSGRGEVDAPTLQMAARWVRDTLDAFVSITPGYPNGGGLKWFWTLTVLKEDHIEYPMQKEDECLLTEEIASTYELAMEDGIRAALNLL